jgi:transposase
MSGFMKRTEEIKKTDKMKYIEIFLEEPLQKFLIREYSKLGSTVSTLQKLIQEKTGIEVSRATVWKWLKHFKIRSKTWM